jgi:DNA-binding response OmpR family regulator
MHNGGAMTQPLVGPCAQIVVLDADSTPSEYPLADDVCMIGRSPMCQIVVPRDTISRLHARIERAGPRYVLHDAGSANGTFVNSRRIYEPHLLKNRDLIGLGAPAALLRFVDPDPTAEPISQLRYDERSIMFFMDEQPLDLAPVQFRLLHHLYQHIGAICTRESCAEAIWGRNYDPGLDSRALDGVVSNLRAKMHQLDPEAHFIHTRQGIGYELNL